MKKINKIIPVAVILAILLTGLGVYATTDNNAFGKTRHFAEFGRHERPEMTEEEKAAMTEKMKADLAEKLENGEISQEEYDEKLSKIESGDFRFGPRGERDKMDKKPERPEMTEEEKAAMTEKMKADLAEKLENGEISQEEYDEKLSKIQSGEFGPKGPKGREAKGRGPKPHKNSKDINISSDIQS